MFSDVCFFGVFYNHTDRSAYTKVAQDLTTCARGYLYQYQPPYYNGFALTVFFYKKPPPTAFTPEPVWRRVAGMKQILLMIAVVALVGCGKKPLDPIVEKAVRKSLEKPTGELTKADLEKVEYIGINAQLTEVPKGLEMLTKLKTLSLENNILTDVKGLEKLTQLTWLDLRGNPNLTKAQIDQLQKALPRCDLQSNPTK